MQVEYDKGLFNIDSIFYTMSLSVMNHLRSVLLLNIFPATPCLSLVITAPATSQREELSFLRNLTEVLGNIALAQLYHAGRPRAAFHLRAASEPRAV